MNGSTSRGQGLRAKRANNQSRSNDMGTGYGQEPSPDNSRNSKGNGHGRGLLVVGFPPFGRNTQVSEWNTSCGRGRGMNCGNTLSL